MNNFKRSKITSKLVDYLLAFNMGMEIPYETLSKAVGAPINSSTSYLRSAMLILSRDHGAVWTCVRLLGIKRLTDKEIVERTQPRFIRSARRKLKRGETEVNNVDVGKLNLAETAQNSIALLQMHAGMNILSRDTRKRLENVAARGNANDLPQFNISDLAQSLMRGKKKS